MIDKNDIDVIILAAGFSSRAGTFKMEIDYNGIPLLAHNIELFSDFSNRIIVVGGHKIERIKKITEKYPDVVLAHNKSYPDGMFSSVLCGAGHVKHNFLITPGDCPFISAETVRQLLEKTGDIRLPVYSGRRGHPVYFVKKLRENLLNYTTGSNLREFIREHSVTEVPVTDDGIHFDIDTQEDHITFTQKLSRRGKEISTITSES